MCEFVICDERERERGVCEIGVLQLLYLPGFDCPDSECLKVK